MATEELNKPVSFPKWAEALAADPEVVEERRDSYRRAIMGYLKHLKGASCAGVLRIGQGVF